MCIAIDGRQGLKHPAIVCYDWQLQKWWVWGDNKIEYFDKIQSLWMVHFRYLVPIISQQLLCYNKFGRLKS